MNVVKQKRAGLKRASGWMMDMLQAEGADSLSLSLFFFLLLSLNLSFFFSLSFFEIRLAGRRIRSHTRFVRPAKVMEFSRH